MPKESKNLAHVKNIYVAEEELFMIDEKHLFILSLLGTYGMKIKFVSFPVLFLKMKIPHTGQNSLFCRVYFGVSHMGIEGEVSKCNYRKY